MAVYNKPIFFRPCEIQCQLIVVNGNGTMTVQHVRKGPNGLRWWWLHQSPKHISDRCKCSMNRYSGFGILLHHNLLSKHLEGDWCHNIEEVGMVLHKWLQMPEPKFHHNSIFKLIPKWVKYTWMCMGICWNNDTSVD